MTHLRIEQMIGLTEYVNNSIIEKLYNLITNSTLDNTSNLQGTIHVNAGYRNYIASITTAYPDFHVIVDNYAIPFEDSNMVTYLNSIGVGSNGMVTEEQAVAATIVANSVNTTITKFNELRYFTGITQSKGGWTGSQSGYARFYNWTALLEVNISNFTSLGHLDGYGYEDTFYGCTSLKTVIASDKLTKIGTHAFRDCSNLESITGLTGTIEVSSGAFMNCLKLTDASFTNVYFKPSGILKNSIFQNCKLLTTIKFDSTATVIPNLICYNCYALTTISGFNNITEIGNECFKGCPNLVTHDIDWTKITKLGAECFSNTKIAGSINLQNITSLANGCFANTKITSATIGGTITSISSTVFYKCSNLSSVTLSSNITSIGSSTFRDCTSLTSFDFSNITDGFGQSAFLNSGLTRVELPFGLTSVSYGAFCDCSSLAYVHIPSTVTTLGEFAFGGNSSMHVKIDEGLTTIRRQGLQYINRLILPSTITSIELLLYANRDFLVIKATSVPTYSSDCFNAHIGYPIYVPDASVAAYKAQVGADLSGGLTWENRIKPISDFATDWPGISLDGTGYAEDNPT